MEVSPKFASVSVWCGLSGLSRSSVYIALGRGDLRAVKVGKRTLIDVEAGLAWLRSRPSARVRPPKS
jgi:hypothetical protein